MKTKKVEVYLLNGFIGVMILAGWIVGMIYLNDLAHLTMDFVKSFLSR